MTLVFVVSTAEDKMAYIALPMEDASLLTSIYNLKLTADGHVTHSSASKTTLHDTELPSNGNHSTQF